MNLEQYDIIIIGTGPAGLQAAIHATRKKVRVLVLGRHQKSSAYKAHIDNYCCIDGITGEVMLIQGRVQAEKYGAILLNEDVINISSEGGEYQIKVEGGKIFSTKSIILAMGISRNKLNVPGEKEFLGHGISYCVECDAMFYKGKTVAIIGCESAAMSGALTLLFYAKEVHLICEKLQVVVELARQIKQSAIIVHEGRKIREIKGINGIDAIILDNKSELKVSGIFIELGAKGAIELASGLGIMLDTETMKYIMTNKKQETNIKGIYAAGDICGPPLQVAKAVGEGCIAGLEAAAYAQKIDKDV